jgi:metal-responsive CopG/Arc/MetJ family transcriptional regulator
MRAIHARISPAELKEFDDLCDSGSTRSFMIATAIREWMERKRKEPARN